MENSSQTVSLPKPHPSLAGAFRCLGSLVLCLGFPFSLRGQEPPSPLPPKELPIDLSHISNDIYFNQPVKGYYTSRHAESGIDFSSVLEEFISIHHLTDLLTAARIRFNRPNLELTDLVIYHSIYELQDPRLFHAMMTAMESGVSVVIVTDGDNALPFKPASKTQQTQWTDRQRAFYLERYDTNRDGAVDLADKTASDYRTRLMKTFMAQTQKRFLAHLRENKKQRRFPHQILRVVMSPHKYVPPEGFTYLPLHHTKLLMVATRLSDTKTIPLEALLGTANATFSDSRGDLKPEVIDRMVASDFLTHTIVPEDFESESKGNINVMVKLTNPEILSFLLEQDILDAIRNYEQGRMFSPIDPKNPPFRDFVLKDSTKIRVGVTRGRPGRGQLGEPTSGYDPNDWIVEFLLDKDQTIHKIEEVVSTEFVYSHGRVHRELQRSIKKHRPKVIGIYDHGFALQSYARVLSLQGITRMTEAQPPPIFVPDSGLANDLPDDPGATTARAVQIIDSPYGMLPDNLGNLRVFSRPLDKMHLKIFMVEYQYKDPTLSKPQTRYRIFWGSLNRTTNGPNNRELFFSIDTPFSFLYKTLRDYALHLAAQEHAIPLKEFYARHLVRSLFRLPPVPEPLKRSDTPPWEDILTPKLMRRLVTAIESKTPHTRARRVNAVLKELSKALAPYSAFAESEGFKATQKLVDLFFNKCEAERQTPKELWLAFHFIATAHTDAIQQDGVRLIADRFFAREAAPRRQLITHLQTLAVDQSKISNAIVRSGFIPSSVVSSERETRTYLQPLAEIERHQAHVRDVVTHAFLAPNLRQLLATLKKATPVKKHTYLTRLVEIYQKLPETLQNPQILYELIILFDEPKTLASEKLMASRLKALTQKYHLTPGIQRRVETVFTSFRHEAKKNNLTFPHFHCGQAA